MGAGAELPIADLERRLAAAVECEDFGLAVSLRDQLKCTPGFRAGNSMSSQPPIALSCMYRVRTAAWNTVLAAEASIGIGSLMPFAEGTDEVM